MISRVDLSPLLSMTPLTVTSQKPVAVRPSKRRLQIILARIAELKAEGLAIYQPLPEAARFHASTAKLKIAEGSNRSGKTEAGAAELARAICGCDPYDKYPKTNGVALVVGLKQDHIAMLWRKLYEPGSYKVIPDEHTKQLRAVRPDPNNPLQLDPYDASHTERWRDSAPLIPHRLVTSKDIAWDDRGKGVPRTVNVPSTGWRLEMRPSGSHPDQGDHYNVVLNDEEMERPDWYYEEVRGLTGLSESPQHAPKLIWTATSQVANPEFAEIRAKALAGVPGFERFVFLIDNNPYVPDAEKLAFWNALPEYERETRYYGIPAISQRKIYGIYEPMGIHGCEPFDIPPDWTRYAIVDPGTHVCATLLGAVDPDEKHGWIYGGFVLRNAEALQWAYALKEQEKGVAFEAIIMDEKAGSQRSMNAADTTAQRFAAAMDHAELKPRTFGSLDGFFPGTSDVKTRTLALRSWMVPRNEGQYVGTPRLQVMKGVLPDLDKQITNAISDLKDPEKRAKILRRECDLLDDLEYFVAFDPRYKTPTPVEEVTVSYAVAVFRKRQRKNLRNTNYQPSVVLG